MDLKANRTSPVLTDPAPVCNSRLGLPPHLSTNSPAVSAYSSSSLYITIPRRKVRSGTLDDDSPNSAYLDAMRCSSPPRIRLNKHLIADLEIYKNDAAYYAWTMKYPSALSSFEQITSQAKYKKIALFLDYDGTLSNIVDNPDHAFMSNAMRTAVKNVAKYFPTAIISGRSCNKVYKFVKLSELYYAGSHGMDIMGPVEKNESISDLPKCTSFIEEQGKEISLFQPAREFLPMISEVESSLKKVTKDIEGAIIENNKFCVSVHYRLVDEKDWPKVVQRVQSVLKDYHRLQVTHGRRVLEVRPVIDWNKGKAVEFLLESLGLNNSDVLPIYLGDDRTDEDAFKVLRDGNCGYGILVTSVPKETNAFYSLRDPTEVKKFLKLLVKWKKLAASSQK